MARKNVKIGDLVKWEDLNFGEYGAFRSRSGWLVQLTKQDWQLYPKTEGVTCIQGITRAISPDQLVIYLGNEDQVQQRSSFVCPLSDYPQEV